MHRPVHSFVPGFFPRIAFVVALTLLGLPISSAQGQATQPASSGEATELSKLDPVALREKAAEWRYQNAELKEKLANALSRIEKLESEVRRLRAYAPPTEAEAARAEKLGPMAAAEKPASGVAKPTPAATESQRPPYTNLFALLQTLPTDVRPVPKTGWTPEVMEKSWEWMNSNLLGTKIDLPIVVTKVEVKDTKPINSYTPSDLWQVEVWHQPIEFEYATTHVMAHLFTGSSDSGPLVNRYNIFTPLQHLYWKVDEATAKRCKSLKPGQTIKLRGNIQGVISKSEGKGRECLFYFRMTDLAPL